MSTNIISSDNEVNTVIKQKRGRKPKNKPTDDVLEIKEVDEDSIVNLDNSTIPCKKRGRKPKGGKIIQQQFISLNNNDATSNVILHLKCSLKDLNINSLNNDVESYNFSTTNTDLSYEIIENNDIVYNYEEDGDGEIEMYKHLDLLALAVASIQDLRKRVLELEK